VRPVSATRTVVNPATEAAVADVAVADLADADRAVETGTLSVNSNTSVRVATPFGGVKQSGMGRELGMHALAEYSNLKNVFVSTER
jgi:acyl-CoA reductase-like NAD-dependent aldehyde dehydrogenase